jgi:hypothetical protein
VLAAFLGVMHPAVAIAAPSSVGMSLIAPGGP